MKCISCKREQKIVGRGYCRACYQRWHKTGSTEYQRWGKRSICQVKDCGKEVVSNGLCDMHRNRLARHGHIEETRPDSWGSIEAHPLRNAWQHLRRYRGRHGISHLWENDFLQFAMDVGDKPTPKHKLYVADDTKPIGPGNFVWKRSVTERVEGEDDKTFNNRRLRVYRALSPESFKGHDLKKLYGISRKTYTDLHELQGGCCAICEKVEVVVIRGKTLSLSVDHCHKSGSIRGLLCSDCNRGLGSFRDDPKILRRAIAYLTRPLLQNR